ncbi:MAG: PIN/TRAM domain-containing protein [Planctomycetota bacterium]|nr:PIN/TRAM domain-containing protein [Planctomycetota bacterium]MDA1177176.1 PIN/TRAM domain-containing protein [Planctomycetota bacterium]
MGLTVLRSAFLLVAAGLGVYLVTPGVIPGMNPAPAWLVYVVLGVAMLTIGVDVAFPRKRIEVVSAVFFGLLIGLLLTNVVNMALSPYLVSPKYANAVQLTLGIVLCYACISLLIQTKDDIRFIIPYVEFAKDMKSIKPLVLDTSCVIDGRIADVMETKLLDNPLIMPRFVLQELQNIADSGDRLRRGRGRRGLDILNKLRNSPDVDFQIFDRELPGMDGLPVDMKLVLLAKHLDGKLVTGDYNLNKVAQLHNVHVLNLNDLSNALKPLHLPGEHLAVLIVKAGEGEGQGVGYLDDGTMIVVEGGRSYLQQVVQIGVTSVLQTSAGRMIFGRFEGVASTPRHAHVESTTA